MIRIGTAGWSYMSGKGKWSGIFYPKGVSDPLRFFACFFETVEVNTTFYRPMKAELAERWAQQVPDGFRFAVKLYQKFTHPKMYEEATGETAEVTAEDFSSFLTAIRPIATAGKLGPLLAQYPPSFRRSPASVDQLERLAEQLRDYQVVVELRHRSWMEDDKTLEVLRDHRISWVHTDEPFISKAGGTMPITGPTPYLRFHGRNAENWWKGDRDERYNYLYSPEEQAQLAQQITKIPSVGISPDTYVAYNNHFGGKAAANALEMKLLLGQPVPDDVPETMLKEFPELGKLIEKEAVEQERPEEARLLAIKGSALTGRNRNGLS
jgi:uncharacterized protein YecE (DUF72 family)